MPYKCPEARKAAAKRWYEKHKEEHKARGRARHACNREKNNAYMREYMRKRRAIFGRTDRPFLTDPEKLHNYKPLQRWLSNPKLSPTVADLVCEAEQKFKREEEKKKLKIIYDREKTRRRKAKMKSILVVQVSKKDLRRRFAEFNDCCAYCGKPESSEMLHIDHFLPVSKGGTHVLGNLVPACKTCNYSKRNHHPEKWYKKQEFFDKKRWQFILKILNKTPKNIDQLSFL